MIRVDGEVVALVGGSVNRQDHRLRSRSHRQVVGLSQPAEGPVRCSASPLTLAVGRDDSACQRRMGMLFQHGALFSAFSVAQNIAFPLRELGMMSPREIDHLVALKLEMVEMEPAHALLMPAELSGGMAQARGARTCARARARAAAARRAHRRADPDRSASFIRLIRALHRELGLTVVLVTHDLDTLAQMATSVAVLAEGRIVSHASLEDTLALDHPCVARFFRGLQARRSHSHGAGAG